MDKWNEELFNNLSRLVRRKSKAASSPNPNQYQNAIPIAISYSSGMTELITRSSNAASVAVGDRWTKKTRLRTTPAEDLRALMFGQE